MRNGELETLLALGDGVCRPFDCGGVSSNGNFRARYFMDVNSPIKWQVDIALITQPSLRITMTNVARSVDADSECVNSSILGCRSISANTLTLQSLD
jgi:hypothetical protein